MSASVLPTTACVESNFTCLRETKSDYRSKLFCSLLEVVLQASDLADIVGVLFTLPARKARH
jgi:hypothetical protein